MLLSLVTSRSVRRASTVADRLLAAVRCAIFLFGLGVPGPAGAENPAPPPPPPSDAVEDPPAIVSGVEFNFSGEAYSNVLPFDQYFTIYGFAPAGAQKVEASYLERKRLVGVRRTDRGVECLDHESRKKIRSEDEDWGPEHCEWTDLKQAEMQCRKPPAPPPPSEADTRVPFCYPQAGPLKAGRHYLFKFEFPTDIPIAMRADLTRRATSLIEEEYKTKARELKRGEFGEIGNRVFQELQKLAGGPKKLKLVDPVGLYEKDGIRPETVREFEALQGELRLLQSVSDIEDGLDGWSRESSLYLTRLESFARQVEAIPSLKTLQDDQRELNEEAVKILGLDARPADREVIVTGLDAVEDKTPTARLGDFKNAPATLSREVVATAARRFEAQSRDDGDLAKLASFLDQLAEAESDEKQREALETVAKLVAEELRDDAEDLMDTTRDLSESIDARRRAAAQIADRLAVDAVRQFRLVAATTSGDFRTRQQWYLSADLGLAGAWEVEEVLPFVAMNIYLRPVNRQASFRDANSFGRRFAFTVGVTEGSVSGDDGSDTVTEDLFGSTSLLLGAGFRVTEAVRLGVGAVVFKEKDPNPLIDETSLTYTPYVSISFDWDIRSTFSKWFGFKENS